MMPLLHDSVQGGFFVSVADFDYLLCIRFNYTFTNDIIA